jgi:hypothetical protein
MPNYRVLKSWEVNERENLIAEVVSQIVNSVLRIRLPGRSFIEEIYNGGVADFTRPEPINGLFYLGRIYVVKDLADNALVQVISHELRHSWQVQNQEYWSSFKLREYDADLFSREFSSYLGHPSGSRIAARLVTTYGMKCGELSPYVRDLILNKGDWKNGVNKYQFES